MSVCCSQCVKTTADSNEKNNKTIFLNISDIYIEYNIFDTDKSVVESNSYEIIKKNCNEISTHLAIMNIK